MRKIILIFLLPVQLVFAQPEISLDSCYTLARENYPNLRQAGILQEISALKKENIQSNHLPQITLNGQATYQSEVTKVDISVPGISIPAVSKDQYKAYAEFRQSIWDGGITRAGALLEEAILQNNLNQLEVELYRLNEQVSQAFFTALAMNKQKEVLQAQKEVLHEKLKSIQSAVKHQAAEKSAALALEAEILNLDQNELQVDAGKSAAMKVLSVLTGKTFTEQTRLVNPIVERNLQQQLQRPELELFSAQKTQLQSQGHLLDKSRNPKIFGFGQAGYGRPGLNMLNDQFDTYYLVGVGLSWNAFDWKKTNRQKQVLQLQQKIVTQQEETFSQNMEILLAQQTEQISKLEKLLETDERMVSLRTEIAKSSASKLENETITPSDYIQDEQAETIARLNAELHRVQLEEAKEKFNLLKGKKISSQPQ